MNRQSRINARINGSLIGSYIPRLRLLIAILTKSVCRLKFMFLDFQPLKLEFRV